MSKRGAKEQARGGKRLSSEESKDTPPHIVHKHKYTQTIPIFALIFVVPSPLAWLRSIPSHSYQIKHWWLCCVEQYKCIIIIWSQMLTQFDPWTEHCAAVTVQMLLSYLSSRRFWGVALASSDSSVESISRDEWLWENQQLFPIKTLVLFIALRTTKLHIHCVTTRHILKRLFCHQTWVFLFEYA